MHPRTKISTVLGTAIAALLFGGVAALATTVSADGSAGPASFHAGASAPEPGAEFTPPAVTPPSVSEPTITPPSVSEPHVTPPAVDAAPPSVDVNDDAVVVTVPRPEVTEPHVEGPHVSEPQVEGPQVSEPHVDGPELTVDPTVTPVEASVQIQIG